MLDITNYVKPFVDVTINTFKEFVGIDVSPRQPHFVDPEKEFMLATQNQMLYTLLAQAAAFEFSQVNQVLRN